MEKLQIKQLKLFKQLKVLKYKYPFTHNSHFLLLPVVPELKLFLGANIQADAVKEGTDVFFECNVRANPWVNEVKWRFEGFPLQGNHSAGVIVSNHSLVLQKVKKEHRGSYQCVAVNSEGEGRSNEVMLKVKCEY